jgi:hypothetical protein
MSRYFQTRHFGRLMMILSGACLSTAAQAGHGSSGPGICQTDPSACYTAISLSPVGTSGTVGLEVVAGYGQVVTGHPGFKLNSLPTDALATFSLTGLPYSTSISYSFAPDVSLLTSSSTGGTETISGHGVTLTETINPTDASAVLTALNVSGAPVSLILGLDTSSFYTVNISNTYSVKAAPVVASTPLPPGSILFGSTLLGLVSIARSRRGTVA